MRHWVSMHGFALNVCGDLKPFQQIIPCGIAGVEMTSVEREAGRPVSVKEVADAIGATFEQRLDAACLAAKEPSAP